MTASTLTAKGYVLDVASVGQAPGSTSTPSPSQRLVVLTQRGYVTCSPLELPGGPDADFASSIGLKAIAGAVERSRIVSSTSATIGRRSGRYSTNVMTGSGRITPVRDVEYAAEVISPPERPNGGGDWTVYREDRGLFAYFYGDHAGLAVKFYFW